MEVTVTHAADGARGGEHKSQPQKHITEALLPRGSPAGRETEQGGHVLLSFIPIRHRLSNN